MEFLVEVETKNLTRGRKTIFYSRERGRSITREEEMDDYYVSDRLTLDQARSLAASLEPYNPQILVSSADRYVVIVYGPRELGRNPDFKKRCKYTMNSEPQISLNLRYPPLSKMINGKYHLNKRMDPDELAADTYCGVDIEVKGMTDSPEIYMNAVVSSKDSVVFTSLDTGTSFVDIDGQKVRIERCKDQREVIEHSAQFIREVDPLWLYGHNIMNFDLYALKKLGDFEIGVDGSEPKSKGGIPHFHSYMFGQEKKRFDKMVVKGRFVIDTLVFARNNLWFPDNKLETIAQYLGFDFQKVFHGEDLDELAQKAMYDRDLALQIAIYNFRDAAVSVKIAQYFLPQIIRDSLDFWTDPTTVCFKSNAVPEFYDQMAFRELHVLRKTRNVDFDPDEKKIELLGVG